MHKVYLNLPRYRVSDLIPGARAYGLKRIGRSYAGPCPICKGHNRFSISQGKDGFAWPYCRKGCTQGQIIYRFVKDGHLPGRKKYTRESKRWN